MNTIKTVTITAIAVLSLVAPAGVVSPTVVGGGAGPTNIICYWLPVVCSLR